MKTIVAKFGGTSLADADQFKKVKDIILSDPGRRIIVASAPGKRFDGDAKITDMLFKCYETARAGGDYDAILEGIKERFRDIIIGLDIDFPLNQEFEILKERIIRKPNRDYIASRGEYFNSKILSEYLGFTFVDPEWCVCFDENGILDGPMTRRAMRAALRPLKNAVIAGFYGADGSGRIHTLSRGGSDVTGSLAACAVDADLYENWTDVTGLLAADPRIVDSPRTVEYLSFNELRTLSYMGASVLHTDSVLPASESGISICIKNTNHPEEKGTTIVRKLPDGEKKYPVIGVAGKPGMSVLQVEKVMVSDASGFSAIILDILSKNHIAFEQCLTGIDTVTLVIRTDYLSDCKEDLIREIKNTLNPDHIGLTENLSMIAVVGERSTDTCDANVRVLQALADAGIEISTINQGAGKLNLLIAVPEEKYEQAIRVIYSTIE